MVEKWATDGNIAIICYHSEKVMKKEKKICAMHSE